MLELSNRTPFRAAIVPTLDKNARDHAIVIIKGSFDLLPSRSALPLAEQQVPITLAGDYWGEPGSSSLRYASDTCLAKPGTDVILNGHACAPGKNASVIDTQVQIGSLSKTVRVFGDRTWYRDLSGWRPGAPKPFRRMPLVYERAFGGGGASSQNPEQHEFDPRNPVGTGYSLADRVETFETTPLPNLEDPARPIQGLKDRPDPAGFGFIAPNWEPRRSLAGTYDDAWRTGRAPLLPDDFDPRFYNAASAGMVATPHLSGGERGCLINVSEHGELVFVLPRYQFTVTVTIAGERLDHAATLDTVVIEPDESRMMLTWRVTVPCPRRFLHIETVTIDGSRLE